MTSTELIHERLAVADRDFRENVIDRLARIESLAEHSASHAKRIENLETWQTRLKGAVLGIVAFVAYVGHNSISAALLALFS